MRPLRHPISHALYELQPDGNVKVTDGAVEGVFDNEGRWISGELEEADLHMILVTGRQAMQLTRGLRRKAAETQTKA